MQAEIRPQTDITAGDPARHPLRIDYRSEVDRSTDWALALPPRSVERPWICCIHGHGSSGDQLYTRQDLRERMLPEFLKRDYGILTPNLRGNAWMCPAAVRDLRDLLATARREFGLTGVVLASGSMGGTSNLIYAVLHPEDVHGVVARGAATDVASYHAWCRSNQDDRPILREIADAVETHYGAAPEDDPDLFRAHSALHHADRLTMPVFLSHGTEDRTIPVSQARRLVGALAEAPALAYVEIPGGNHDSPLFVETVPHALDWIAAMWERRASGSTDTPSAPPAG